MDKCPDGYGERRFDTASPRGTVGDADILLVKLICGYRGIPSDRNPYVLSLILSETRWAQRAYESCSHHQGGTVRFLFSALIRLQSNTPNSAKWLNSLRARENHMTTIRLAEPYDLSPLTKFDSFPGNRIAEIVEKRMLVAEMGDVVVGYLAWQRGGCVGQDYVNKLVVNDIYRRRGIARDLIGALNTVLSGRVFISTGTDNDAAVSLLESTGWVAAGQIVGLRPLDEPEAFFHRDLWPAGVPN
ncbi:acetyltransferase (GNAT) family protein [Sphingomonas aerolata]|uniref:Acetyltransferase (GNAT) family protein n=2 Tax=Sphingomonas aerolata TaxID=185951 RepID=A0A2T4YMR1_9SPHN|nr:acetyltransferase (GNAT) family protein [Sphingomonas aerolata]